MSSMHEHELDMSHEYGPMTHDNHEFTQWVARMRERGWNITVKLLGSNRRCLDAFIFLGERSLSTMPCTFGKGLRTVWLTLMGKLQNKQHSSPHGGTLLACINQT